MSLSLSLSLGLGARGRSVSAAQLRIKEALANSDGLSRQVSGVDPLTMSSPTSATSFTSPVTISRSDARLRYLGGPWVTGSGTPGNDFIYPQNRTTGETTTLASGHGVPANRSSPYAAYEFTLPAGDTEFEVLIGNYPSPYTSNFFIDIDGLGTNSTGYNTPVNRTYNFCKFTIASSASDRVIRVMTPGRMMGGLRLPTGKTIGAKPVPALVSSLCFLGDSITAGSNATTPENTWAAHVARRLGVDNFINTGVGSSGYLARNSFTTASVTTTSGSASVAVVSGTLVAGHYISGPGIPRDATVTVGATAGGTATISANATASATVTVRDETGRNFLDRYARDVLQCVDGGPPDCVVVSGGINDRSTAPGGFFADLPTFSAQVLALLQGLHAGAPNMHIFVTGSWTDYNNPDGSATVQATSDAIEAACAQVPMVTFIDVTSAANNAEKSLIWSGDITHPIDYGHEKYADVAFAAMSAVIGGW